MNNQNMKVINPFLIIFLLSFLVSSCNDTIQDFSSVTYFSNTFRVGVCPNPVMTVAIDGEGNHSEYEFTTSVIDTINNVNLHEISFMGSTFTYAFENEMLTVKGRNYADSVVLHVHKGAFMYPYEGFPKNLTMPKTQEQYGNIKKSCL